MNRHNYLLTIALDKYNSNKVPPLNNAKFDANRLISLLSSKYGFEHIGEPLFDKNATRRNIIDTLNSLSSWITQEDNLIIYFAGHGIKHTKTGRGYWLPFEASESISDYLSNSEIIDSIHGIEAKHILLISDSCFSGTFLTQTRSNDFENHYSKLDELKSRWVLTSGRDEKVSDGQPGMGSPFANALLKFLEENQGHYLSIVELFAAVQKQTGIISSQQPIIGPLTGVGHEGGQMVLVNIQTTITQEPVHSIDSEFQAVCVPFYIAEELKIKGFTQKSIFGYYRINEILRIKKITSVENLICCAYTFEEIASFIPEFIDVDENTYLAQTFNYIQLGPIGEHDHIFAEVTFQRTTVIDTPFMAICRCKGSMVAFSINSENRYNNLISWGKNQAEAAGIMALSLFEENKIVFPDPDPEVPEFYNQEFPF